MRETICSAVKATSRTHATSETSEAYVDRILQIFKLTSCADTKIGNNLIRGVSGGERRRVTLAEALIRRASVHCWDNSTRGMDSSTALDIIKAITNLAHVNDSVAIVSVYQASQAIFECFTKVLLLHEGRQVFFGRTEEAEEYFVRMGFRRPMPGTSTADFLTSLTNPEESQVMLQSELDVQVPVTAEDFERRWYHSQERKDMLEDLLQIEADQLARRGHEKPGPSYRMISFPSQVALCLHRGASRLWKSIEAPVSGIVANGILGLILGSLFYDLDNSTDSFYGRGVLLFYATMLNGFMSGFEVITIWAQRPIVEKHRRLEFYQPISEAW